MGSAASSRVGAGSEARVWRNHIVSGYGFLGSFKGGRATAAADAADTARSVLRTGRSPIHFLPDCRPFATEGIESSEVKQLSPQEVSAAERAS